MGGALEPQAWEGPHHDWQVQVKVDWVNLVSLRTHTYTGSSEAMPLWERGERSATAVMGLATRESRSSLTHTSYARGKGLYLISKTYDLLLRVHWGLCSGEYTRSKTFAECIQSLRWLKTRSNKEHKSIDECFSEKCKWFMFMPNDWQSQFTQLVE